MNTRIHATAPKSFVCNAGLMFQILLIAVKDSMLTSFHDCGATVFLLACTLLTGGLMFIVLVYNAATFHWYTKLVVF